MDLKLSAYDFLFMRVAKLVLQSANICHSDLFMKNKGSKQSQLESIEFRLAVKFT